MAFIDQGNGPGLVINSCVALFITWVFFSIRVYVRWFMLKVWKIEDWLFVASQASFTLLAVVALMAAVHGNGQKVAVILQQSPKDLPIAMQYWFAAEIIYLTTVLLIRLSIGFFILRVCVQKRYAYPIKFLMALMSLLTVAFFFFTIFQCAPIRFFWLQFSGLPGKCLPAPTVQNVTIVYAVFAAVTDIVFGVLPIFVVWNLKLNRRAKIIVTALLMLGVIAGLSVIVRIEFIRRVSLTEDFLFATSSVSIWSMIEPCIAICCMSASTYRPLFKSLRDKSTHAGYSAYNKNASAKNDGGSGHMNSRQFRLSRSMGKGGYLKSVDTMNSNSYEDVIKMETLARGPGKREGRGSSESSRGIMTSTVVEIKRERRSDDIV